MVGIGENDGFSKYNEFQNYLGKNNYDDAIILLLENPSIKQSLSNDDWRNVANFYESIILGTVSGALDKMNADFSNSNSKLEKTINEIKLNNISSQIHMEDRN